MTLDKSSEIVSYSVRNSNSFNEFVIRNHKLFEEHKEGFYLKDYLPENVIDEILNKFESSIIQNFAEGDCDIEACYCLDFNDVKHTMLEKAICVVLEKIEYMPVFKNDLKKI